MSKLILVHPAGAKNRQDFFFQTRNITNKDSYPYSGTGDAADSSITAKGLKR